MTDPYPSEMQTHAGEKIHLGGDLSPVQEQTRRLSEGIASIEQEINRLESRLHQILQPEDEKLNIPSNEQAVPIRSPYSPHANELGAAATHLSFLAQRIAVLHDRLEL